MLFPHKHTAYIIACGQIHFNSYAQYQINVIK